MRAVHVWVSISGPEPDADGVRRMIDAVASAIEAAAPALLLVWLAAGSRPADAGALAADFPDLTGDDPRLEPASRARARRWVENAVQAVRPTERSCPRKNSAGLPMRSRSTKPVASGQDLPASWPVDQLIRAAAEAAAAALHAIELADFAPPVFENQR